MAVPTSPHGSPSAALLPNPNRLESQLPAASITPVTPFQIAVPMALQSTLAIAESLPSPNSPDRKLPAMSSTPVTPFHIAVPISAQLISLAAVLPASNRLFSQPPAVSRIDWMPS